MGLLRYVGHSGLIVFVFGRTSGALPWAELCPAVGPWSRELRRAGERVSKRALSQQSGADRVPLLRHQEKER
jgi:hypothetical protein